MMKKEIKQQYSVIVLRIFNIPIGHKNSLDAARFNSSEANLTFSGVNNNNSSTSLNANLTTPTSLPTTKLSLPVSNSGVNKKMLQQYTKLKNDHGDNKQ